jgi:hypothetical protein
MKLSKRFVIPMAVAGAIALGAGTVAMAASSNQPGTLAQKIATTFHLDPNKVQDVIDQNRTEKQAAFEQKYEDRLNQAVKDGKITSAQKDAILTEHNKIKDDMAGARDLSDTDRRALMQKIHTEIQNWSKQNNLSARWLGPAMGHGPGRGMGVGHMGQVPPATQSD